MLSDGQRHRLEEEKKHFEQSYKLQCEKIARLRNALVIETDPSRKFQYEQQIKQEENELKTLADRLDEIEKQLQSAQPRPVISEPKSIQQSNKVEPKKGDIRFTMLGASNSGKTCYLLSLYALMQLGLQGFTLSARDLEVEMKMASLWENLISIQNESRWPLPDTKGIKRYFFDLSYGFKKIIEVEWLDYSNGSMSNLPTDHFSSCLLLFISGEILREEVNDTQLNILARKAGIHFMNRHLHDLAKHRMPTQENPFPVVIVISKYDQCYPIRKQNLILSLKKMFHPLFLPHSNWLTLICPISLGKEVSNNSNISEICPKNLHLPLVFALYCQMRFNYLKTNNEVSNLREKLEKLKMNNWLNKLLRSDESLQTSSYLQSSEAQIIEIQKRMALFAQELTSSLVYLGGKEIEIDI